MLLFPFDLLIENILNIFKSFGFPFYSLYYQCLFLFPIRNSKALEVVSLYKKKAITQGYITCKIPQVKEISP